jgi:hypothetical protein
MTTAPISYILLEDFTLYPVHMANRTVAQWVSMLKVVAAHVARASGHMHDERVIVLEYYAAFFKGELSSEEVESSYIIAEAYLLNYYKLNDKGILEH